PRALEHYLAPFRDPSRVHAMCEDYRAGAYADYEIDKRDFEAGSKITIPMLALWGDAGIANAAAPPLDTWKKWATNVSGAPVDSGHFLTEENPEVTGRLLREFFTAGVGGALFPRGIRYRDALAGRGAGRHASTRARCEVLPLWISFILSPSKTPRGAARAPSRRPS